MKLWMLFDAGKNPIPVVVRLERPNPEDLICRFRGHQSLVDERMRWAQSGNPPTHDYQWLGPFNVPVDDVAQQELPRVFEDQRYEDEEYSLAEGPWGRSDSYKCANNPHGVIWYVPGYDEVPLNEIPTDAQCENATQHVGYLVDAHLNG